MSLATDKFFYWSLNGCTPIDTKVNGRIFNTARPEIDEDEDKIPYIIISNEGTQNGDGTKDEVYESDTDTDTINLLIVCENRDDLAELAETVRQTIREDMADFDEEMAGELGFSIEGYSFSASRIEYDASKPCYYQTLTYNCETLIQL